LKEKEKKSSYFKSNKEY